MVYGVSFFVGLIYVSLVSLIAVFLFQVWSFIKDIKENNI